MDDLTFLIIVSSTPIINQHLAKKKYKLDKKTRLFIIRNAKLFDKKSLENVNFDDFIDKFSIKISDMIMKKKDKESMQNIQNMQNNDSALMESKIDISKLFGMRDLYALQKLFNPRAAYEHNYIVLNTKNRTTFTNGLTKFNWQLMEQKLLAPGTVNTDLIKDLVGMRILPMKFIPYRGFANNVRFNLLIEELASQSFFGYNGRRFHFVLESTYTVFGPDITNDAYIEMSPKKDNNMGYFWFDPPITTLNSFTVSLADYNGIINMPTAFVSCAIYFTNPMSIAPFTFFPFQTGDQCIISQFTLNNPTTPLNAATIAAVNDAAGYPITIIPPPGWFTGPQIFTIPIDLTVVVADAPYYGLEMSIIEVPFAIANIRDDEIGTAIPIELISLKQPEENN